MAEPRILILGAKGMLGTALADQFSDFSPALWDMPEIDITNEQDVQTKIAQAQQPWTHVVNAAAYTAVDDAENNESLATQVNGDALKLLADACNAIGATLVHYSTDYVFAGDNSDGYREEAPTDPLNAYGRSKLVGEEHVRSIAKHYYLIRTAWLYGPNGKNFVDTMHSLGDQGKPLTVVHDQHGSPTYTHDLAAATRSLIEDRADAGAYHFTNDGQCTWYEFAVEIFKQTGQRVEVTPVTSDAYPRPAKRPAYSVLLNTKRPKLPKWQDGLLRYLQERPSTDP